MQGGRGDAVGGGDGDGDGGAEGGADDWDEALEVGESGWLGVDMVVVWPI